MAKVTIRIALDDASLGGAAIYKPRIMRLLRDVLHREYPDAEVRVAAADTPRGGRIEVSDESLREPVRTLQERVLGGACGDWREPPLRLGIAENGTWAATALYDGTHVDCPVVLGADPAVSGQACAAIEGRLAAGETSGTVRIGEFEWEFDLVEEG